MRGKRNELAGRMAVAWPGLLATGIAVFWLGLWAIVMPSPASLGVAKPGAGLIKPRDVAFIPSVAKLKQLFVQIDYHLDAVRTGARMVPPLFLASVPSGMKKIKQPLERKRLFLRVMLPLVLKVNDRVLSQRTRLLAIKRSLAAQGRMTDADRVYLKTLAREYGVRQPRVDHLLSRVDIVPVSIALAQSAIESGWGTSRFTREGNAAFGQWTTATFEGIVPLERPEGETYKIRSFDMLLDSVRSYVHNINTHRAYRKFRAMRASMRSTGARLDSLRMIRTLTSYSEEGASYVKLLGSVIKVNRLAPLDRARLGERLPPGGRDA